MESNVSGRGTINKLLANYVLTVQSYKAEFCREVFTKTSLTLSLLAFYIVLHSSGAVLLTKSATLLLYFIRLVLQMKIQAKTALEGSIMKFRILFLWLSLLHKFLILLT